MTLLNKLQNINYERTFMVKEVLIGNQVHPAHYIGTDGTGQELFLNDGEPLFPHYLSEDGYLVPIEKAYAVYLPNGPIYGVGANPAQAWEDAKNYTDTKEGLVVKECSLGLYAAVKQFGDNVKYMELSEVLVAV